MNKKILIVGVLDVPSSTNVAMAKGFEQLGYEVEAYNYRTKIQVLGSMVAMSNDFCDFIQGKKYKLIVFCKVNQMSPKCIFVASKIAPTWYWFMDPINTANAIYADTFAQQACYSSATSSEVVKLFKEKNPNSFHIIEGFDPDVYYYEEAEKLYDITFIGNATPKRMKDILELREVAGDKTIHVFGSGWPESYASNLRIHGPVYNEDERIIINHSKILLNLCQDNTIFSDRVVKTLACGAASLSQNSKDLKMFYGGLGAYDNIQEAKDLLNLTLNEKEEALALEIQKEVAKGVKENNSWNAVCWKILEKVK